jgi:Protein of unknown function (DUF3592)
MIQQDAKHRSWKKYFLLLVLSTLLVGVLWLGLFQWVMMSYRSISVSATLVSADRIVKTLKSGGGKLALDYRYTYLGTSYVGDQTAFGSRWMGHSASSDMDMQAAVDRFSRKSSPQVIEVWIDPAQPHESALLKRVHPGLMYITLFLAFALVMGVLNALFQIRKLAIQPNH